VEGPFRIGRLAISVCVILIWLAGILQSLNAWGVAPKTYRPDDETRLAKQEEVWRYRRDAQAVEFLMAFFQALGFLLFIRVSASLRKVWGMSFAAQGALTHYFFTIGCILPAVALLQDLGSTQMANWITSWDELAPRALALVDVEFAFIMNTSRTLWVTSMQFIFFAVAMWVHCDLVLNDEGRIPRSHGVFSAVVGIISVIVFALKVSSFEHTYIMSAYGGMLFVYYMIMLPVWMIWLAVIFGRLKYTAPPMRLPTQAEELETRPSKVQHDEDLPRSVDLDE